MKPTKEMIEAFILASSTAVGGTEECVSSGLTAAIAAMHAPVPAVKVKTLLDMWRDGAFESSADEAAQDAIDSQAVGLDASPIIEAWLSSLSATTVAPAPDLSSDNERLRDELTPAQKEIALLRIAASMGGTFDSSDKSWNWLNWFCDDAGSETDTFNRCNEKGWLFTTHNSDNDTSRTVLTAAGRAALERKP